MSKDPLEQQADELLREWAKDQGVSLRKDGIIDERRERTVRERETPFASFFANKKKHKGVE